MRRSYFGGIAVLTAAALTLGGAGSATHAADAPVPSGGPQTAQTARPGDLTVPDLGNDNKRGRLADRQAELRKAAVAAYVHGEARLETRGGGEVIAYKAPGADKVGYVQYASTRTDAVWSILSEFGEDGPLHNQFAKSAAEGRSDMWVQDHNQAYYQGLFSSNPGGNFTDFYKKASNGKLVTKHVVEDWVKVPHATAFYGAYNVSNGESDVNPWGFIKDTVTAWSTRKKSAGWTDKQIADHVAQFDKWDRYDWDGDGNFNEPDGYIDHFQAIHAGEGEEAGGGVEGENALRSHRGTVGDVGDGSGPARYGKVGGARIPGTDVWVADYTVEPEDGSLGVFVHEFGHDLGLNDYYSTSGYHSNSTGIWTLMARGFRASTGPTNLGPHERLLLGWSTVMRQRWYPGTSVNATLSPAAGAPVPGQSQTIAVALPRRRLPMSTPKPFSGGWMYWTGNDSGTRSWLRTAPVTVPTGGITVSATIGGAAERGFDQLTAVYLDPNTGRWEPCLSTATGKPFELTGEVGVIDDETGLPTAGAVISWKVPAVNLTGTSLVGKKVTLALLYKSHDVTNEGGYYIDNLTTVPSVTAPDGGETETGSWYAAVVTSGSKMPRVGASGVVPVYANHYYLLENRQYVAYDTNLAAGGTYSRGLLGEGFYGYNNGMLVWYVNEAYADNDTDHPGEGFALPVDANPVKGDYADTDLFWTDPGEYKSYADADLQSSDSTFKAPGEKYLALHLERMYSAMDGPGILQRPALPAVSVFHDSSRTAYWNPEADAREGAAWSVKTPHSGLKVQVLGKVGAASAYSVRITIPANFPGQWS